MNNRVGGVNGQGCPDQDKTDQLISPKGFQKNKDSHYKHTAGCDVLKKAQCRQPDSPGTHGKQKQG